LKGAELDDIERVYRSRGSDFFRLAYATTGDIQAARDAVQEGFARAVRHRGSYRRSGLLDAWVARCVLNAARDENRSRRAVGEGVEPLDPSVDVAAVAEGPSVDGAAVRAAVRQLPPRQRDVLFLRYYLGFDYGSIAEALGLAVGTVSATLHAARTSVAQNLQEVTK
jgi:RNA polymerase sigma-70 factor (ECF subfamily)